MIVKVLGRNIAISVLSRKLRELWKPRGAMHVMDLPRHFFMVRFELEEEYLAALTGGPWRAFGSYLMAQAWSPEFDPLRDDIVTTPVWVRLSNIPVNFYHKAILMGIARGLGKPIRVDLTTLNFERARFARICVEVNLTKPLKGTIMINGERYFVSYEGLSNICSTCGLYGHAVHNCPKGVPDRVVETVGQSAPAVVNESRQTEEGFTMVRRQGRRTGVNEPSASKVVAVGVSPAEHGRNLREIPADRISGNIRQNPVNMNAGNIPISNRFGGLDEDTILQPKEGFNQSVGNKENESESRRGIKGKGIAHVNEGASGRTGSKGKGGNREGWKEKRAGGSRPVEINGPKFKNSKQIRPSRGLVFGPIRKEFELLESGKRQRIGNGDVGKVAGCFAKEGESSLANQTQFQNMETVNDEVQGNREAHSQNMDIVMPKGPPEKEATSTVA